MLLLHTLFLKRILGCFRFGDVDNAVDVERDLFCVGTPVLIVETIYIFAVFACGERVVARGYGTFVDLVTSRGRLDLGNVALALNTRRSKSSIVVPRSQSLSFHYRQILCRQLEM